MTWSIVARDQGTGHLGIAVASGVPRVGSMVPFIRSGVGAIASQGLFSPMYGTEGLKLLEEGSKPRDVIQSLTTMDPRKQERQVHIIASAGRGDAFTGNLCLPWCGHIVKDGCSVAGNSLQGPEVIAETLRVFLDRTKAGAPFVERFLDAMDAGEAAGGDKRGRQSAAIVIFDGGDQPSINLQSDDAENPLAELRELYRSGAYASKPTSIKQLSNDNTMEGY